ncbi:hypothetical protein ACJX0J_038199, partial [Zea mays]
EGYTLPKELHTISSYQCSFGIMENNGVPPVAIRTAGYINSHKNQKPPELGSGYPWRFCEHQVALSSEIDPFKVFKLPERCKISKDHKEVPPIDVKVLNDMTTHACCLPDKQHSATQKCYDSREDSQNVITSSQRESLCPASKPKLLVVEKEESTHTRGEDPSQCYPGVEGNMMNMASESSSSTRAIFLKLMHNLSVVLLLTCKGGSLLHEDEEDLLQSVIQNLTAASSKRSKIDEPFLFQALTHFMSPRLNKKTGDGLSNSSQMKLKNINCARNNFWRSMHEDSVRENADSEFKATVSQYITAGSLTNHQEDKMLDNTKVSQASIYRNLWIEAEASACKLKYELQHAHLGLRQQK